MTKKFKDYPKFINREIKKIKEISLRKLIFCDKLKDANLQIWKNITLKK